VIVDQFDIGTRRSHRLDGAYGMVGIIRRDDPNLEGTASRGCRPGRLYPNEKCLSHGPQYGMLAGTRKWAVKPQRLLVTIKLTHYPLVASVAKLG
jgi:hypothetical protein